LGKDLSAFEHISGVERKFTVSVWLDNAAFLADDLRAMSYISIGVDTQLLIDA
jgi:hypothetical protein